MKNQLNVISTAGLLVLALVMLPEAGYAQRSGVEIWSQNCGRCHQLQPPNRYTADQWETIVDQMMLQARLTDDEAKAVLEFLKGGAKKIAMRRDVRSEPVILAKLASTQLMVPENFPPDSVAEGKTLFQQFCTACHGKEGKGNGPVAAALNPKPRNLTKKDFQAARTDAQLEDVLTNGKNTMPGFGTQLSPDQIKALVAYIRTLEK